MFKSLDHASITVLCSSLGFTMDSYAAALGVAVPLLALLGVCSLIVEEINAFYRYDTVLVHC